MTKTASLLPVLSIDSKKNCIRVHKKTLHMLGDPSYIQLLINPEERLIAIRCSRKGEKLSHRVKYNCTSTRNCFELYSTYLLQALMEVNKDWQKNQSYRIYGTLNTKEGIAQFKMDNVIQFRENQTE